MKSLLKMLLAVVLTIQFSVVKSFADEDEGDGNDVADDGNYEGNEEGSNVGEVPKNAKPGEIHTGYDGRNWQLKEVINGRWAATPIDAFPFEKNGLDGHASPGERSSAGNGKSLGRQRITGLSIQGYEDDTQLDKSNRQAKEAIRQRITNRLNDETTKDADKTTTDLSGEFDDLSQAVANTGKITYSGASPTDPLDPLGQGGASDYFNPLTGAGNGEFYADQAGWQPFDDHEYQSDHKEELNKLRKRLNYHISKTPQQADAKRTGYYVLNEADKAYVGNDAELGNALKNTAIIIVDIATDIIPITAAPKDFYRVVIGKDPFTGEALGKWERAMAAGFLVAGIVTLGGSNVLSAEARALAKAARLAEEEVAAGVKVGEAAIEAGNKWSRSAKTLQDQMALNAAHKGAVGQHLEEIVLKDPRFKGMEKWEYRVKSNEGKDSVIHWIRDPKTGKLMDFKFKKHSID